MRTRWNVGGLEFREEDVNHMERIGISRGEVISQIEMFKKGPPYLKLKRPCIVGDGIRPTSKEEQGKWIAIFERFAPEKGLMKFVPASGAASRMFKTLLWFNHEYEEIHRETIASQAHKGDRNSRRLLTFMDGVRRFAFYEDLEAVMANDGLHAEALVDRGQFKEVIDYLLSPKGLDYTRLPKGLLKFHRYSEGTRTPFEEHLVEARDYVKDDGQVCHIHFTVSMEHKDRFEALWETLMSRYQKDYGVGFHVDFSVQERSTDTIAVDQENKPFRLQDGSLLFRPGGHGALIDNLNDLKGDVVFIKNIDNVVPDRLKGHTSYWKKVLGECLLQLQERIFFYLARLSAGPAGDPLLSEAFAFANKELCQSPPWDLRSASREKRQDVLVSILNRPLRVCGMVRNEGEPGGGPFWVEANDGSLSLQVVERVEVDPLSQEQQKIQASSTHFNPVDIVCALRDFNGNPFDLKAFVNTSAVFISKKSKDGRKLRALERPGLWNGAMAHWNTVFIEVPVMTFNPVKMVNDLLRKEHQ